MRPPPRYPLQSSDFGGTSGATAQRGAIGVFPKNQKGVTIMCSFKRLYYSAVLSLFLVVAGSSILPAQTALTTLQGTQGGMIIYGLVDGATTPAMAMARILHNVQNGCGEKPQVGKVFRVRSSNSDAVFFTVTNHAGGNVPVAGMVIASQTGPGKRCQVPFRFSP